MYLLQYRVEAKAESLFLCGETRHPEGGREGEGGRGREGGREGGRGESTVESKLLPRLFFFAVKRGTLKEGGREEGVRWVLPL